MVVVRKKGCVAGDFPALSGETGTNYPASAPFQVLKMGHILPGHHSAVECIIKSSSIVDIRRAGYRYYQVTDNESSCALCGSQDGAIYPAKDAEENGRLPPFHPNCKCTIQGFSTENPTHDPWLSEILFWLELMYGEGSAEQKAQRVLDFYGWKELLIKTVWINDYGKITLINTPPFFKGKSLVSKNLKSRY